MSERERDTKHDPTRREFSAWLWRLPVLAALAAGGFGAREAWRVHFGKAAPADPPSFEGRDPVEVAPLERFAQEWDAVAFDLAGTPCLAVRLPLEIPGSLVVSVPGSPQAPLADEAADEGSATAVLAGFSRICTHLGCLVDLNLDEEAIAFAFNHRGDGPQLTCACHYSVFDPRRAGLVVSGPAVQPLPRVRLRLDDREGASVVLADGLEATS